jgi:DNA (cytosine-5)-methyltransferase 1
MLTSVELCAGAGGQALGLEQAGFEHVALFENDPHACQTLRHNRPRWRVEEHDLFQPFDFSQFKNVGLLAGGLPCPPFSVAGKQLGERDERNLFTRGVEIAEIMKPNAIMFENVRGMLSPKFDAYRDQIELRLRRIGYKVWWHKVQAAEHGVPQLRPRVVMVALKRRHAESYAWAPGSNAPVMVGTALADLMAENGWTGANAWAQQASRVAPTIVGGSKKHGGPDLGPTRARAEWATMGVDGGSVAEKAPGADFIGMPKLTNRMVARLQGFPDDWHFVGRKTAAYRQIGNAFPPPVARSVAEAIRSALTSELVEKREAAE